MSEPNLNEDEWATILLSLKVDREKAEGMSTLGPYIKILDGIISKIEAAQSAASQ